MRSNSLYVERAVECVAMELHRWQPISVVIAGILTVGTISCREDSAITRPSPNNEEALAAIQFAIAHGAKLLAVPLPRGVIVSRAIVQGCVSATPQNGYRCNVSVATADIPIVGGLAAELVLRFSKGSDGRWMAFIN